MDIKEIRTLIDLMKKNGLAVFKMEREDFKITLKTADATGTPVIAYQSASASPSAQSPTMAPAAAAASSPAPAPAPADDLREIASPMVGTFYSAPSPDSPAFVSVGQPVGPDTVVCIIEAMKVMNEIKAETTGTIAEICAENGKPVQFGQPLFRIK